MEARVLCLVYDPHATAAQLFEDAVMRYGLSDKCLRHCRRLARSLQAGMSDIRFRAQNSSKHVATVTYRIGIAADRNCQDWQVP